MPLTHLPRQPTLLLELTATSEPGSAPWLFSGAMDSSLENDLVRLPLTAASQERVIPTHRAQSGHDLALLPQAALRAGAHYTLALPLSGLSPAQAQHSEHRPWSVALNVDDSPSSGAALRGSYPASGAAGVSPNLSWLALSFDGEVYGSEDGVWLENVEGYALPGVTQPMPCELLDTAAISCMRWLPATALAPATSYTLRTGQALRDAHGAEIEALRAELTTAAPSDGAPPLWQRGMCAVDERALEEGCVRVLDDRLELRLFPNANVRVHVELGAQHVWALPQREGVRFEVAGLPPDTEQRLQISGIDAEQRETPRQLTLRTAPQLPTLSISEVYADPAGKEPDQEYVELWNYGSRAVPLAGLFLGDSSRELGQRIESEASLVPGARALLVSESYSLESTLDAPPRAGTLLVRMGKALTPSGLSNRGQALYLRDAAGRRLSATPERPAPQAGLCLSRVGLDPRAEDSESFRGGEPCTPGE